MKGTHDLTSKLVNQDEEIALLRCKVYALSEPWCREGGGQAQMGECPTHHGDGCLRTPAGLVTELVELNKIMQFKQIDPLDYKNIPDPYDPEFGDDNECQCGHPYYRHFDTYEEMYACGCKYCDCYTFKSKDELHKKVNGINELDLT